MPELLKMFTPGSGSSPRRGVLRALATVGAGAIVGGLGTQSADAKKGKNKNKGKNRCKKCPRGEECADFCVGVFTGVGGQRICGHIATTPNECTPCTSFAQCLTTNSAFGYCVTEAEVLATGEKAPFACEGSPPGMCVNVFACAPIT